MSDFRRKILIGYCIAMAIAAVYVPWKIDFSAGQVSTEVDRGYALFFSPPNRAATIDYGKVALELVAITALAGVLYVVASRSR